MSTNNDNETRAYHEERLRKIAKERQSLDKDEAESNRVLGITSVDQMRAGLRAEDEGETLFDRLTPAELMHLYETDREQWHRILGAKRAAGERKLIKW